MLFEMYVELHSDPESRVWKQPDVSPCTWYHLLGLFRVEHRDCRDHHLGDGRQLRLRLPNRE